MPGIEVFLLIASGPKGLFSTDRPFFKIHESQKLDGGLIAGAEDKSFILLNQACNGFHLPGINPQSGFLSFFSYRLQMLHGNIFNNGDAIADIDFGPRTTAFKVRGLIKDGLRYMDFKTLVDPVKQAEGMQIDDNIGVKQQQFFHSFSRQIRQQKGSYQPRGGRFPYIRQTSRERFFLPSGTGGKEIYTTFPLRSSGPSSCHGVNFFMRSPHEGLLRDECNLAFDAT